MYKMPGSVYRGGCRGLDAGSQVSVLRQSQSRIPPDNQSEASVVMGEILKMITGLAEIIVQRETKRSRDEGNENMWISDIMGRYR